MLTQNYEPFHNQTWDDYLWLPKEKRDGCKDKGRAIPVTVCIAAICERNRIIMVSDRMITRYGITQSEPNIKKLFLVSPSVSLAMAGDVSLQAEIISRVTSVIRTKAPVISTREIANQYYCACKEVCFEAAEGRILSPLGLSGTTFIGRLKEFPDEIVNKIRLDLMQSFNNQEVAALIAGVDDGMGHIFEVDKYGIYNHDYDGFAAIGIGAYHANSQFALAGHTSDKSMAQTLVSIYSAKKIAEMAPGVGKNTDMVMIGPERPELAQVLDPNVFDAIYEETRRKYRAAYDEADAEMTRHIEEVIRKAKGEMRSS